MVKTDLEYMRELFPKEAEEERTAGKLEIAMNMKKKDFTLSEISRLTGLSTEQIKDL